MPAREKRNLIGPLNGGWTVAKRLLQFERQGIGNMGNRVTGANAPPPLPELAKRYCGTRDGRIADPLIRDRVARLEMQQQAIQKTMARSGDEAKAGQNVSAATSSSFKLIGTECNQARFDLMTSILGSQSLGWDGDGFEPYELETTRLWLRSFANTIEGGTSEVQLNIIAKRVLGLPD